VFNNQWDDNNIGYFSFAGGRDTIASGLYSVALGYQNTANNDSAVALGYNNTASGQQSFAAGFGNIASGNRAVALGHQNTASGDGSVALGYQSYASAFGAVALGVSAQASGHLSAAIGDNSQAIGSGSVAIGFGTKANSLYSIALGTYNLGFGNPTSWVDTDPILELGIGTDNNNRKNAITILKNGYVGIKTTSPSYALQVGTAGDGSSAIANAWNTFSDIRLKEIIGEIKSDEALEKILNLQAKRFYYKSDENKKEYVGFIAQEVEEYIPEVVSTDTTEEQYKAIAYEKLIPFLVEAVKQLYKLYQELKGEKN
jgi:autotransporter adhesin